MILGQLRIWARHTTYAALRDDSGQSELDGKSSHKNYEAVEVDLAEWWSLFFPSELKWEHLDLSSADDSRPCKRASFSTGILAKGCALKPPADTELKCKFDQKLVILLAGLASVFLLI